MLITPHGVRNWRCGFLFRRWSSGFGVNLFNRLEAGGDIFRVWHSRRNCAELLFFGVCGMMLVSYSYFASIRYGNAAAATVLQYLMPAMIVLYTALRYRRWPSGLELFCVLLALAGTVLLVTHGDWRTLAIPLSAFLVDAGLTRQCLRGADR